MPRFKVNRRWILILTLSLAFALVALTSTHATAGNRMVDERGPQVGGAPPPGDGDPDTPMSSLKRERSIAVGRPAAGISTRRAAGDGMSVDGVMMWEFHVVMQSLRLWTLGSF